METTSVTDDMAGESAAETGPRRPRMTGAQSLATAALVLVTAAVYARTGAFDFIDYDDNIYVTENTRVLGGLTADNVRWALTTRSTPYWHPLTWLSHMLDVQLWGTDPGPPHMINTALHTANALLVLLVLNQLTGQFWLSLITASLFALHPLRVESVAWVSERKDVLCGLFYLLTIGAYVACVGRPTLGRRLWLHLAFVLALMSKPMAVTLPCVLLLLDYWPLGRMRTVPWSRLVIEKLGLFGLAIVVGIMAIGDQADAGALKSTEYLGITHRVANAVVAYGRYIGKIVWPRDLVIFYPHPGAWPLPITLLCAAVIVSVTAAALLLARRMPFVIVGWLWFVGTLAPVIGLLQAGRQSLADRFTYLPSIGLTIAVVWGISTVVQRASPALRSIARGGAVVILVALTLLTIRQLGYWAGGTIGVFQHALDVDETNFEAHHAVGYALTKRGRADEAMRHLVRAREIEPRSAGVHFLIGEILFKQGQFHDAITSYKAAAELRPDSPRIWQQLAAAQFMTGDDKAGKRSLARAAEPQTNPGAATQPAR